MSAFTGTGTVVAIEATRIIDASTIADPPGSRSLISGVTVKLQTAAGVLPIPWDGPPPSLGDRVTITVGDAVVSVVELVPNTPRPTTETSLEIAGPAYELAERIARTDFVPSSMRGKPEAVLAAILTGYELGIGPMQSLAGINVIEGKPALSAELMRGLVLAAGHELWIAESTNTRCTVGAQRRGSTREQMFTWTMDDAKRAGLDGKGNWRKYPRSMLQARATTEAVRAVFPDVVAGVGGIEELTDGGLEVDDIVGPIADTPKRARARRPATNTPAPLAVEPPAARELPPLPGEPLSSPTITGESGSPSDGGGADHPAPPPDEGPTLAPPNAIAAWCAEVSKHLHPDYTTHQHDQWRHDFLTAYSHGAYHSSHEVPAHAVARLQVTLARVRHGELHLDGNGFRGTPPDELPLVEDLTLLTVAQLADRLRALGIVPAGNKATLIELLQGADG